MICFPNCKINIGLFITEKRNDGYHNIETIFYPVALCDILEIIESKKIEFTLSGNAIPGNIESNLCIKAYNIIKEKFDIPPVKIHLHKVIPTGAGLGGGSSDAAYMIKLLNTTFSLNMEVEEMKKYAAMIGSDCAFFIENKAVFAHKKGDEFKDINLNLKGYEILLVKPNVHISTPEAYSMIKTKPSNFQLNNLGIENISSWKNIIKNDFEEAIFKKDTQIKEIKEKMYEMGALYSSMSGSGSAVYGIFNKTMNKEIFTDCFVWQGKL